jgi:tyrosyl-tRNA synthetase
VEDNVNSLTTSIQNFFKRASVYASARMARSNDMLSEPVVTNNLQWHSGVNMLEFLQKVGVHARVNTMLNRERYALISFIAQQYSRFTPSVRARLNSQQGLSFTEFTYQLLQAYDFYHLHQHFGCTIQVGGSDQWGNILAGLELIARIDNFSSSKRALDSSETAPEAFGITTPLLTAASGEKFGKSAGNAIWLDSNMTSVFDFYQVCNVPFIFGMAKESVVLHQSRRCRC